MERALLSLMAFIFTMAGLSCYSQTSVSVSDPRLEMAGNTIHIFYDILNSIAEERYTIGIVIKDEDGDIINAGALEGDIGEGISGGSNKQITWDLEADNIFIDAYVFVQISATRIPPRETIIIEPGDDPGQEEGKDVTENEIKGGDVTNTEPVTITRSTDYNRTGVIFQSIVLPGLGMSRVTGKPHWIRGLAGYGCLAGSIVMGRQAVNTYNGIDDLIYFDEINSEYDKTLKQDNISNVLLYAAAGIWITDFIWTLVGTSDLKKKHYAAEISGFSVGSYADPFSNIPMLSVSYRF